MNIVDIIKRNILELCKAHDIDAKELAKRVGVNAKYFVQARKDFAVTMLQKVAEVFEIKPEELWDAEYTRKIKLYAINRKMEELIAEKEELETAWIPKSDPEVKR